MKRGWDYCGQKLRRKEAKKQELKGPKVDITRRERYRG